jgi:hypothetical protein
MNARPRHILVSFALASALGTARSASLDLPPKCAAALDNALPGWKLSEPPADAAAWAKARRVNPVVTRGDFDGNGAADYAALVNAKGSTRLAVCMSRGATTELLVVERPYCTDLVYRSKAKSKHHNFDTGKDEFIKHDGVSVSCFEKAGATYVYEKRKLREIVDSD